LQLFITHRIESLIGEPKELDERLQAAGRGLVYQLRHGLGTVAARDVAALASTLTEDELTLLQRHAIVVGKHFVYSRRALRPPQQDTRRALLHTHLALPQQLPGFGSSRVSYPLPSKPSKALEHACLLMGFPVAGDVSVRVDVIERVASEITNEPNDGILSDTALARISQLLGCKRSQAAGALASLGYHAQSRDVRHRKRSARRRRRPGSSPAAA
jgi:hypothetical protein